MRESSKRALSVGLAGIFFIATIVVYASLIKPKMDSMVIMRASVVEKENFLEKQKQATTAANEAVTKMNSAKTAKDTMSLAIPVGPGMTQALSQIDSMAVASKVSVDSFTITPATPEASAEALVKRLGKLDINMTVSGNYDSAKGFLKLLETNIRVVNVKSFEFIPGTGQQDAAPYSLKIVAEMFYQEN
ncbi:MAG: type 4a pilus biogenesis protein PilO [Candidatus Jorgensenbacteria bacterium]|nr:type 4a pilus biogenesis protein PilO [Candidatus Jorgensenbacteria bacterium]